MNVQIPQVISQEPGQDRRHSLFSDRFCSVSPEAISRALADDGYYVFERAISEPLVKTILDEASGLPMGYNRNDVGPVRYFRQTFFAHVLAGSPTVVKLITDPMVLAICAARLGSQFRLKCQRYYESGYAYELGWHSDNKTVDNRKTAVNGIVFIIYLTDTYDGELQVVRKSNQWSGKSDSNDFSDAELRSAHAADICPLPRPRGTIIITDTFTIHRTRKITTRGYTRKSLFFQVDDDLMHSEKILLNSEYLPPMTEELMRYLGFGLPSGYASMPVSGLNTLTTGDLFRLAGRTSLELVKRFPGIRRLAALIRS